MIIHLKALLLSFFFISMLIFPGCVRNDLASDMEDSDNKRSAYENLPLNSGILKGLTAAAPEMPDDLRLLLTGE